MSKTDELFDIPAGVVAQEPKVHTMVRGIARTQIPLGDAQYVDEVDREVGEWVNRGYRLVNTHLAGFDENNYTMIYVLSK